MKRFLISFLIMTALVQCGGSSSSDERSPCASLSPCETQFSQAQQLDLALSQYENGNSFGWGLFIREQYMTPEVRELPVPVYLAYFNENEAKEVRAGIQMANEAIGFDVFEEVESWDAKDRIIYKVSSIEFDGEAAGIEAGGNVVGYTYNRNVYINGKYDAGRVVTDWAIEIREDHVNRYVVAHELGHAMGIQKHGLIDYDQNKIVSLEDNSLMSAVIGPNPTLDDYNYMMERQGEILLDYMEQIGVL